jgi:hypothetical protein
MAFRRGLNIDITTFRFGIKPLRDRTSLSPSSERRPSNFTKTLHAAYLPTTFTSVAPEPGVQIHNTMWFPDGRASVRTIGAIFGLTDLRSRLQLHQLCKTGLTDLAAGSALYQLLVDKAFTHTGRLVSCSRGSRQGPPILGGGGSQQKGAPWESHQDHPWSLRRRSPNHLQIGFY